MKRSPTCCVRGEENPDRGDPGSEIDANPDGVLAPRTERSHDAGGQPLLNINEGKSDARGVHTGS